MNTFFEPGTTGCPDSSGAAQCSPEPRVVTLQSGLMVCHTTAACLDAVDTPKCFSGDCEFLHLNCQLDGFCEGRVGVHPLAYRKGDMSLGCSAGEEFQVRHCEKFQNLAVMVSPQTLEELAGDAACALVGGRGASDFFLLDTGSCRKALRSALNVVCLMSEFPRQRLLLHAATLDYLHWHLAAFRANDEAKRPSQRECRQLDRARDLLLCDLSTPPTIAELAQAVGMNQYKLKVGFKRRFGCSIYALFQEERMQQARRLLQSHNVTETAVILGYTNISHFSAAFRKQFGCLPSQARHQARGDMCGLLSACA
ncbi:helix-turn-helix transcriptional regulator [Thiorhodococcus fuscus]|uniref:Helix-turn-helix transcriptional regulator n=1 Tax=Thiorhodococcus fuscus TaxID=527200 RepID=A0ABW4Y3A9_9GAMM